MARALMVAQRAAVRVPGGSGSSYLLPLVLGPGYSQNADDAARPAGRSRQGCHCRQRAGLQEEHRGCSLNGADLASVQDQKVHARFSLPYSPVLLVSLLQPFASRRCTLRSSADSLFLAHPTRKILTLS